MQRRKLMDRELASAMAASPPPPSHQPRDYKQQEGEGDEREEQHTSLAPLVLFQQPLLVPLFDELHAVVVHVHDHAPSLLQHLHGVRRHAVLQHAFQDLGVVLSVVAVLPVFQVAVLSRDAPLSVIQTEGGKKAGS